jgi:hypothetical protein
VDCAREIAPLPPWIATAFDEHDKARRRTPVEWHAVLAQPIPNGQRNSSLASVAGKLIACHLDPILAADLLMCVNLARCDPPLDREEVETILLSVGSTHARRARA